MRQSLNKRFSYFKITVEIKKIQESSISFDQFDRSINELITHLDNQDPKQVKNILDQMDFCLLSQKQQIALC